MRTPNQVLETTALKFPSLFMIYFLSIAAFCLRTFAIYLYYRSRA